MIKAGISESRAEQTRKKDSPDVSWAYETDNTKTNRTKSPFVYHGTPIDLPSGASSSSCEELNEQLVGVTAALSVLETYERAVRFVQRVPKFSRNKAPSSVLRHVSEEEVADTKQQWDDFVIDLTHKNLLCHSPSTSVDSLSDSEPPLPTTPKTTPPPFEHFQLNSAAAPFVPRDPRLYSPGLVSPSFISPPAKDDIGLDSPTKSFGGIPGRGFSASHPGTAMEESRVSPAPGHWGGRLASSSSSSDLSSMSNGDTPSLVADEEGWIVMDTEPDRKADPKKSPKSKLKSRKQQVQIISFPTLLAPPGKNKERTKESKNKDNDEGWIECLPNGGAKPGSPKQQKGRHNKSRSSVSTTTTSRGHVRQASMPALQHPPLHPPHPNGYYYGPPSVYPTSGYMLPSPYPSFQQAMVPIVPVAAPNGWVLYPTIS